ncbi:MAG: hypothetical protein NT136_00665 [Candidatus Moranbacteria bacterium]|nr:hypothetical protein [Candidatus Moranbacteria bacterium]
MKKNLEEIVKEIRNDNCIDLWDLNDVLDIKWNREGIYDEKKGDCRVTFVDDGIGCYEGDVPNLIKTLDKKGKEWKEEEEAREIIIFLKKKFGICIICKHGLNLYQKEDCDKHCSKILKGVKL